MNARRIGRYLQYFRGRKVQKTVWDVLELQNRNINKTPKAIIPTIRIRARALFMRLRVYLEI